MKIAVLLTCHNRREKTLSCLKNLLEQNLEDIDLSVYLVDDGSSDGTSDAIKEHFPEVNIIEGNGELYWNRGMHLAWTTALKNPNWDAVLWLNDDTILNDGALKTIVKYATQYKNSIIVGSVSSVEDQSIYTYGGYQEQKHILQPVDTALQCSIFNGNAVLVPRIVSDKIGILDYKYRHAGGDFEYGIRANKNGFNCYAIPIIGRCDRNGSYVKWMDKKYNVLTRLKLLYSPIGKNPFEAFYYTKNTSYRRAVAVFFYLHLKAIFPQNFHLEILLINCTSYVSLIILFNQMSFFNNVRRLFSVDWIKSSIINIHHFGLKKGIHFPILIGYGVKIASIGDKGGIIIPNKFASLCFGLKKDPFDLGDNSGYWFLGPKSKLIIKGSCRMSKGIRMKLFSGAILEIGDGFTSNANLIISCSNNIIFGSDNLLGWNISIMDNDGGHKVLSQDGIVINHPQPIYNR